MSLFGSFRLALGVFVCAGLGENVARMICFRFEVMMVSVVFGGGYREDFGGGDGRLGRWRYHTTQDGTKGIRHVSVQALEGKNGAPSSKQFVHLSGVRAVLRLEGNAPVGWSIVRREKHATAVVFCVPYPALPCPPPRLLFCREWEKSLQIIQGDVLKVPLPFFDVLVANVPYNVSLLQHMVVFVVVFC